MTVTGTVTETTPVRAKPDDTAEQVTQLLPGEPVEVVEDAGEWTLIVATSQPSSQDERGYPGWVRTVALTSVEPGEPVEAGEAGGTEGEGAGPDPLDRSSAFAEQAREYLGVPYVWGGLTGEGIDCSGLTHRSARELGMTIPRDARDQAPALEPVPLDQVRAGDLYFFARPGQRIHHVGIATGPMQPDGSRPMIHASYAVGRVVEEAMDEERQATLVAAARLAPRQPR